MRFAHAALSVALLGPLVASCGEKSPEVAPEKKASEAPKASGAGGPQGQSIEDRANDFKKGANEIAAKSQGDCDKFGTELEKYAKDNQALIKELSSHVDGLSTEERTKFDEATGGNKEDEPMYEAMTKCAINPAVIRAKQALRAAKTRKGLECEQMIESINTGSKVLSDTGLEDAKQIDEQTRKVEDFEKKLGELALTDATLKEAMAEYRKLVKDMAALTRDLKDASKLEGLAKRSKEITDREDALVKRINGYCGLK